MWRGKPAAERKSERRARLFEATLDVVESQGIGGVTVRGVCAASGLTARYFYESFSDITDLLLSLYDDSADQGVRAVGDAIAAAVGDDSDPLRSFVRAGMGFMTADPRRTRFLLVHAAAHPEMHRRRRRLLTEVADHATRVWVAEVLDGSELVSTGLATRFALGGLLEIATAYLEGDLDLTEEQFADAAVALIRAFVTAEGEIASI